MKLRSWLRIAGLLLLLAVALSLLIRSAGGDAAKTFLLRAARNRLPATLEVNDVELSLWPPGASLRGVEIREGETARLRAGEIDFELAWIASLWEGAWIGDLRIADFDVEVREESPIWRRMIAEITAGGAEVKGESSFMARGLIFERGRVMAQVGSLGLRAGVTDLTVRAEAQGVFGRRIRFEIDARASAERAGANLTLRRVSVRGEARADELAINEATLEGDAGALAVRGRIGPREVQGRLDWDVVLDPMFALLPEAGVVRGQGTISAAFSGPISAVEAITELKARSVFINDVEFSGSGRLRSHGLDWELVPARAEMFGGSVEGEAHGRFVSEIPFEVRGRFRDWDPATFIRLFGPRTPIRGAWDGEAQMEGLLFGDDLKGGGTFVLREKQEQLLGHAQFTTTKDSAEVEGAVERSGADRLHCHYRVEQGRISGEVDGVTERLSTFGPFVRLALAGRGRARARFAGTVDEPLFTGEAEMDELSVEGIDFGRVRGPFEISRQGLRSSRLEVSDGRLRAVGLVALTPNQENDWSVNAEGEPLEHWMKAARMIRAGIPELGGVLDGDLRVIGRWPKIELTGRLNVTDFSVMAERLGKLSAELTHADRGWNGRGDLRGARGAKGSFQLKIDPGGTLSSRLTGAGWRIENISAIHRRWPQLVGQLGLSGAIVGTVTRPVGEASVEFSGVEFSGRPLEDSAVSLRLDGERAFVDAQSGKRLRLAAVIGLSPPHGFTAQADWRELDLGALLLPRSRLEVTTRGDGQIRGDFETILREGAIRVTELAVGHDQLKLSNRAPIVIGIQRGLIEIADTVIEGGGQRLRFGGRLGPEESAVHAEGKGDLTFLEAVSPGVTSARGEVTADVKAVRLGTGPWRYQGEARLRDGAVDFGFQVSVTEIIGAIRFDERRVEVRELTGKLGEGRFLVEGDLGFDSGWGLGWALRDASPGFPPWLDYRASGNGRLEGPFERPKLSGEIEVTQAVYDRRIEWAEFLPWFRREARIPRAEISLPVDLDLHVFAEGGLFVDNNLTKAEMRGDFRVGGSREAPKWSGRLDVLSGGFTFRRRSFNVTAGTIQFNEAWSLNPDLELGGETTISTSEGDYQIAVRVSGTAENPRIEFTADDPSLTENDVLALVTFGRTVAQLQSQGAGIELNEVLALTAGPRAAGKVEEQIFSFLPVDRIEIEPAFSRTTGATEPRLSIGKDLAQGFRALLGTGLGAERRQDVALEYQLTPRISVQGIWESQSKSETGAFGGDLKFRFPFRNLTPFTMIPSVSSRTDEP